MVYTINGEQFARRKLLKINTAAAALVDYQTPKTIPYMSAMQSGMADNRFTTLAGVNIPYWEESIIADTEADIWLKVPSISNTVPTYLWQYYGSPNVNSASSISDTFILGDDFPGTSIDTSKWDVQIGTPIVSGGELSITGTSFEKITSDNMFGVDTILTVKMKEVSQVNYGGFGFTKQTSSGLATNDVSIIYQYSSVGYADNRVGGVLDYDTFTWTDTDYHTFDIIRNGASSTIYKMDGSIVSTRTTQVPSGDMYVTTAITAITVNQVYDYIYLRKYTASEPTWAADGPEQHQRRVPQFVK